MGKFFVLQGDSGAVFNWGGVSIYGSNIVSYFFFRNSEVIIRGEFLYIIIQLDRVRGIFGVVGSLRSFGRRIEFRLKFDGAIFGSVIWFEAFLGAKSIVMVHVIFITSEGTIIIVFFVIFEGDAEFFHIFLVLLNGLIRDVVGQHRNTLHGKPCTNGK